MKYNIRGSKIDVTEAINDYIKSKLSKLEKYLDDNEEVEAKALISTKGKDQKVEGLEKIRILKYMKDK